MILRKGVDTTITFVAMLQITRSVHLANPSARICLSRRCSSAKGELTSSTIGFLNRRATSTPVKLNKE